jgi:hypothetical protein
MSKQVIRRKGIPLRGVRVLHRLHPSLLLDNGAHLWLAEHFTRLAAKLKATGTG